MIQKNSPSVHPACDWFPMMSDAEYAELKADIEKNGQQASIVYWKGFLVDGRNRLKACLELGLEPDACELDEETDPVQYVLSHNLYRRHLTQSQKSMVGAKMREHFDVDAKERQEATKAKPGQKIGKAVEQVPPPTTAKSKARDAAGKAVGVSGKLIDAASVVLELGCPELQSMVERGEIAVQKAREIAEHVKCPKEQVRLAKENPINAKKKRESKLGSSKQQDSDTAELNRIEKWVDQFRTFQNQLYAFNQLTAVLDVQQLGVLVEIVTARKDSLC